MIKNVKIVRMILLIFMGSIIATIPTVLSPESTIITSDIVEYKEIDYGTELRSLNMDSILQSNPSFLPSSSSGDEMIPLSSAASVGDVLNWYTIDSTSSSQLVTASFRLRAIGGHTEIWVQEDLSYPDSRPTPEITDTQLNYMLSEFENTIYPIDTEYFGDPDFHDGTGSYFNAQGRDVVLVSNIRDDMYYDDTYPYYIAGFYWSYFESTYDRNIISIDCRNFDDKVGTVAHEYQHLIHDDYNTNDDTFMNEGCSMYAELLCGYDVPAGYTTAYFTTPDNSLTLWKDQGDLNSIADYGCVFLWTTYLADHFGGADLISYFVQNGVAGVNGINQALSHFGYSETFDEIYRDWTIANYLLTDAIGGGKYNYDSITIDQELRVYNVASQTITDKTGSSFGETMSYNDDGTGIYEISSYGSDYIELTGIASNLNQYLTFDGDNIAGSDGFYLTLISMEAGIPTGIEFVNLDSSYETTLSPFALSAMTDGDVAMIVSTTSGFSDYKFSIYQEVDNPPSVDITSPSNGATVGDIVLISADAIDGEGIDYVQYQINGGLWIVDNTAPYQWSWDTNELVDGQSYTINVQAFDTEGNSAEDSITVVVDNREIYHTEVEFTGAVAGYDVDYYPIQAQPGKMTVSVSWSASNDIDCYIMTAEDYSNYLARGYTTNNPESCSYTIPSAGTYYVGVRMYTSSASSTAYTLTVGYYTGSIEDQTPTVSITGPTDGETITGDVLITADASDDVGIDYVQYQINGGSWITDTSAPFQWTWDTTGLDDGQTYTIVVRAYDTAGQYAEDSISVIVQNEISVIHVTEEFSGSVSARQVLYFAITAEPGLVEVSASWGNSYDIDVYICQSQSYTSYLARGYTTNNPETCSYDLQSAGTYYIAVRMYSSSAPSTAFALTVSYYKLA